MSENVKPWAYKSNPLWLADALAQEGGVLARMDISVQEDVELYEKSLRLIGTAYPFARRFAEESLEHLHAAMESEKRPVKALRPRHEEDTHELLYNLLHMVLRLPRIPEREAVLQLIAFVECWPEQYLSKLPAEEEVPAEDTAAGLNLPPDEVAAPDAPGKRFYMGKEVLTQETFDYATVKIGDYVEEAVVDDAMDCLPPACMSSRCSQMGEPYSHREDPVTGNWRATYATFKRCLDVKGIWEYCGHCFQGEDVERGKDPVYC